MKEILLYSRALMLLFSATAAISGPAETVSDNRTVVEGRVWDYYIYEQFGPWWIEPSREISGGYHFEGTQEFNGVEYNVFRDSVSTPVAYMREEEKKVYLYIGLDNIVSSDIELGDEILLYDFSLKEGDSCLYTGFLDDGSHWGHVYEAEIVSTGEMEYKGNGFSFQDFYVKGNHYNEDKPYRNIEGLGNVHGLLPFPQFANVTSGLRKKWETLLRVSDSDGNIIYENEELLSAISGIESVSGIVTDETLYDLHGHRVSNPVPGSVYIKGGKKYIGR